MIDINAEDFAETFDITKATVGVIGQGFVGRAVTSFFKTGAGSEDPARSANVLVYDKAFPELGELAAIVKNAEVIFVAVPTPMENDGSCHVEIVKSVISDIEIAALRAKRPLNSFVIVIKSTVKPGFTIEMQELHLGLRIVFSPEFLTEKNSIKDFEICNRIILGGDFDDAKIVYKYFQGVIPGRVERNLTHVLTCDSTTAEMVKLYANGILMAKILFSNEVFLVCEQLGVKFDEVRMLALLDTRIGAGHTLVPGPDGQLGAGGHCFPKDINNLRAVAREEGTNEKIFTAMIERNNEIREDKDWLRMKDRAVIDV